MSNRLDKTDQKVEEKLNQPIQEIKITDLPQYKELDNFAKEYNQFTHLFDLNANRFESSNTVKGPEQKEDAGNAMKTFEGEEKPYITQEDKAKEKHKNNKHKNHISNKTKKTTT